MPDRIEIPRLVVAGTASGVGKTTFTVGLVRALRSRGLKAAVFKWCTFRRSPAEGCRP